MSVVWMNTASWLLRRYVTARRSGHERQGKEDEDCSNEHVGQKQGNHWSLNGSARACWISRAPAPCCHSSAHADCTARYLNFGLSAFKFEWGLRSPKGFLKECERACLDWRYEVAISATGFRPTSPILRRWLFWIILGSSTSVCFAHDYWIYFSKKNLPSLINYSCFNYISTVFIFLGIAFSYNRTQFILQNASCDWIMALLQH